MEDDAYRYMAELSQKRERAIDRDQRNAILKSAGFLILIVQFLFNALIYWLSPSLLVVIIGNLVLSLLAIAAYYFSALDTERRLQHLEAGGRYGPDFMKKLFGSSKR